MSGSLEEQEAALRSAKEDGDISVMEYVSALQALRRQVARELEEEDATGDAALAAAAAPAAGVSSNEDEVEAVDDDDEEEELLIDEDGLEYDQRRKRQRVDVEPSTPIERSSRYSPRSGGASDQGSDQDSSDLDSDAGEEEELRTLNPGDVVHTYNKGRAIVVRIGTDLDFYNKDRVYIRFQKLKPG